MFRVNKSALLCTAAALVLAACGGGGSSNTPKTTSGKAVDGYLSNAVVVCDANDNGSKEEGETWVMTDNQGGFTFTQACKSTLVVTAGTNTDTAMPFKGMLKAPAGSTVVTPLTTLLAAGMTSDEVSAALGLVSGADLSRVDPAARNANGALVNATLLQRTLAVQQLMQQATNVITKLGGNVTSTSGQAIYSEVVKAVAQVLKDSSRPKLIGTDGKVDVAVVNAIVKRAVSGVASSANPLLASVKEKIAAYSSASIAELVAESISAQSELLASSAYSPVMTKSLQSNPTTENAAAGLAAILESGHDNDVDMTSAGAQLKALLLAQLGNDAIGQNTALGEFANNVGSQATLANVNISFNYGNLHNHADYFSIAGDLINIDGKEYLIHDLLDEQNISLNQVESIKSFAFKLNIVGNPIPRNSYGERTAVVKMGVLVEEAIPNGRQFQGILDKVVITVKDGGGIAVSVPDDAHFYIHGRTPNGVEVNATLTNLGANMFSTSDNNIDIELGDIYEDLESTLNSKVGAGSAFNGLFNATGRFYFKILLTEIDVRKCDEPTNFASYLTINVKNSGQAPVSGFGAEGYVTILASNPI